MNESGPDGLEHLLRFLAQSPLTERIGQLERDAQGLSASEISGLNERSGVDSCLLTVAMKARAQLGRLNDLIHAVAIMLVLPRILEPGEILDVRPSLASGNDPARPFDVETNRRVAEFKFAVWKGSDAMRKRETFKDFVNLAAHDTSKRAELYVLGEKPIRFLRSSTAAVAWGLDRAPAAARLYDSRFGDRSQAISNFVNGAGAHVLIRDLSEVAPDLILPG